MAQRKSRILANMKFIGCCLGFVGVRVVRQSLIRERTPTCGQTALSGVQSADYGRWGRFRGACLKEAPSYVDWTSLKGLPPKARSRILRPGGLSLKLAAHSPPNARGPSLRGRLAAAHSWLGDQAFRGPGAERKQSDALREPEAGREPHKAVT